MSEHHDDLIPADEAATVLGVTRSWVHQLAKQGQLPEPVKLGRRGRFWHRADVHALLLARTRAQAPGMLWLQTVEGLLRAEAVLELRASADVDEAGAPRWTVSAAALSAQDDARSGQPSPWTDPAADDGSDRTIRRWVQVASGPGRLAELGDDLPVRVAQQLARRAGEAGIVSIAQGAPRHDGHEAWTDTAVEFVPWSDAVTAS